MASAGAISTFSKTEAMGVMLSVKEEKWSGQARWENKTLVRLVSHGRRIVAGTLTHGMMRAEG